MVNSIKVHFKAFIFGFKKKQKFQITRRNDYIFLLVNIV